MHVCDFRNDTKYFLYVFSISSLPMSVFGEMHSLELVSLANNSLKHLMRDVFQPIIENVQVIDVHRKYFLYSC